MAYYACSQPLFDCRSVEAAAGGVPCLQLLQPCCYVNLREVDNRPLFDCWSDDESGLACRPCAARRPQLYLNENGSDSSLLSCNSDHALKQWTTCCRPFCCPSYPSAPSSQRRNKRRSKWADDDEKDGSGLMDAGEISNNVNRNRCTTTRKRQANRSQDVLVSDMSDADDADLDASRNDEDTDVHVNNNRPAKVDLTSCNSSFSDCSLPCHQLITCSSSSQLAKGRVKMSIRPPVFAGKGGNGQCFDDDCLNIKFVGNFVDIPDEKIEDERQPIKRGSSLPGSPKHESFMSQSADAANDNGSAAPVTDQPEDSKNVNVSSRRTRRQWSNTTSEKSESSKNQPDDSISSRRTRRQWSNSTSEKSASSKNRNKSSRAVKRQRSTAATSEQSGHSRSRNGSSRRAYPSSTSTCEQSEVSKVKSPRSALAAGSWSTAASENTELESADDERDDTWKKTALNRRMSRSRTSEKSGSSKNRNKSARAVKRQWSTAATSEQSGHSKSRNGSSRRACKQHSSTSTCEQSEVSKAKPPRSALAARSWSTAASENTELESVYDDTDDTWRKSTLNRQLSRTRRKHRSSEVYFDEEDFGLCTKSPTENGIISEQSDEQNEQEVLFLYGKIREIIRGPDVNAPDDVTFLAKVVKTDAEINKETLSPLMVVKEPPTIENAVGTNSSSTREPDTRATSQTQVNDGKSASNAPPPSRIRSEPAERAAKAACARAASSAPHQPQCDVDGSRHSSTTDTSCRTLSASAPEVAGLRDSMTNLTEPSSVSDLVLARRTTTLYSRGSSPWITDDSEDPPTPETANSASDVSRSTAPPPPRLLSLHNQHQVNVSRPTRSGKDLTSALSRLPRPVYRRSPSPPTDPSEQDTVDWTDQTSQFIGYVAAQSRQSSPVQSSSAVTTTSRPSQLASCLKYPYSTQASPLSSRSSMPSNSTPQRRRRIRFASEVKQRN